MHTSVIFKLISFHRSEKFVRLDWYDLARNTRVTNAGIVFMRGFESRGGRKRSIVESIQRLLKIRQSNLEI